MCARERKERERMFVHATLIHHTDDGGLGVGWGVFKGTNNNGLRDQHGRKGKENERGQKGK